MMVKPAGAYLDIIRALKDALRPHSAYQVSASTHAEGGIGRWLLERKGRGLRASS